MEDESRNEEALTKTAVTFAMQALSSDMKELLYKKVSSHIRFTRKLGYIVESLSKSPDRKVRSLLTRESPVTESLRLMADDQKTISGIFNMMIDTLIRESKLLRSEEDMDN